MTSKSDAEVSKRAIYLIPNLLTTGGLFSGFFAIIASINQHFIMAAIAILIATLLDNLDGRIARLMNAQSAFGAQYDSMADMLSFGITPAIVVYQYTLHSLALVGLAKLAWLSAFLYVACTALRLARYNVQVELLSNQAKPYFFGIPCPPAAAFLAVCVWMGVQYHLPNHSVVVAIGMAIITVVLALLMVCNLPYASFKTKASNERVKFAILFMFVMIIILIALRPADVLFVLGVIYIFSGPSLAMVRWLRRRKEHQQKQHAK